MNEDSQILYYIHDPMCSWCWGFRPVLGQLQQALSGRIEVQYVLGGLAEDTDQPMPVAMQNTIKETWRRIQQEIPATEFNYDFWVKCQPRRSTYPACRAVIASKMQSAESEQQMILAIQQAYYLNAKNPSDDSVLIKLAEDIGLDLDIFVSDFRSEKCRDQLEKEMLLTRDLYVSSFPALVLSHNSTETMIHIDYNDSEHILQQIFQKLTVIS